MAEAMRPSKNQCVLDATNASSLFISNDHILPFINYLRSYATHLSIINTLYINAPPIHHFFIMISHRICIDRKTDQIRIRNFCYLRAPICIPAPV